MSSGLSDTFGFTSQGVNPSSSFLSVANPTPSHFDVSTDDDHGSKFHTGTSFSRSFATSTGFVPSGSSSQMAFATSTPTPTDAAGSVTDIPGLHTFIGLNSTLNASLSLLLIGLMLASISFGAVGTKALMYFRHSRRDRMATWLTIVVLVLLNLVQMIFTAHAVYTSVIVNFGDLDALLKDEWSIMVQIGIVTLTASMAQTFFACRLHAARHYVALTVAIMLVVLVQLVLAIYSVVQMFQQGYAAVMLFDSKDIWPMATTFGISGGLNITIAALGYIWLQKPYVFKIRGRVTVMDEAEYWTFKSIFVSGILSLYNAIGVSIMGLSLGWLMITFVLGNLYTLSVMLNVAEQRPSAPSSFVLSVSPEPPSETSSTRRDSTATLTPEESLWNDIVKSQSTYPVRPTSMRVVNPDVNGAKEKAHALGYHTCVSVV